MQGPTGKLLLLCTILLSLNGCSLFQVEGWLPEIPGQSFFQQSWQQDRANQAFQTETEYLSWVRRFYTGVNPVPGWLELTDQLLDRLPAEQQTQVSERLYQLGGRIGSEWAKDNRVRKINSRMANVWRDALLEALSQDDLDNYLTILEQDVEALLVGELDGDAIFFERYYVDEFDF